MRGNISDMAKLNFDGSCGPKNPGGTAAYGYVLDLEDGYPIYGRGVIGEGPGMTNNLAEFVALAKGLEEFEKRACHGQSLMVKGDSQLVIKIMKGTWNAKEDKAYFPGFRQAKMAQARLRIRGVTVHFFWVAREENELCDALSKTHREDGPLPVKYATPPQNSRL